MMRKYRVVYDTEHEVNKAFEVDAQYEQDAWDAFYYEIETEEEVERKNIIDLGFCD